MDGSECRLTALVTLQQTGRVRTPKYCGNIRSTVGCGSVFILLTCESSQDCRPRRDDITSGGPRHQLRWMEEVVDKDFKSKRTVMEASSDLAKSLVVLNRKILW